MGTSRALRGPTGPGWRQAGGAGQKLARSINAGGPDDAAPEGSPPTPVTPTAKDIEPFGEKCREALAGDLTEDPDQFGLRPATLAAAERLVDALAALMRGELVAPMTGPIPDDPTDAFRAGFVERVAGDGTLVVDTVVRRAANRCVDKLTEPGSPIADGATSRPISGELFCGIYRMFFGEVVGEFLKTAIAAKIQLAVPVLPLLPMEMGCLLAEWVADKAVAAIPNPCDERELPAHAGRSLPAVATELLGAAFRSAVGLEQPGIGHGAVDLVVV